MLQWQKQAKSIKSFINLRRCATCWWPALDHIRAAGAPFTPPCTHTAGIASTPGPLTNGNKTWCLVIHPMTQSLTTVGVRETPNAGCDEWGPLSRAGQADKPDTARHNAATMGRSHAVPKPASSSKDWLKLGHHIVM